MLLSKLTARHTTITDWAEKYLEKPEYRFQNMLEPVLYADSRNLYNLAYRKYKEHLLFRSKSTYPADNTLVLINIWDSVESHDAFTSEVNRQAYLDAFQAVGVDASYEFLEPTLEEATALIKVIVAEPNCIIQELHPIFGVTGVAIGDPLKVRTLNEPSN